MASSTRELVLAIAHTPLSASRCTTRSAGIPITVKLSAGIRSSGAPMTMTRGRVRSALTRYRNNQSRYAPAEVRDVSSRSRRVPDADSSKPARYSTLATSPASIAN